MYNKLFEKGQIGPVRVKNRIVMTSTTMGYGALNHCLRNRSKNWWVNLSQGQSCASLQGLTVC